MDYPCDIDCEWLATDNEGRLAAMITAGKAPIPSALLEGIVEVEDIGDLLLDLPRIAASDRRVLYPNMRSIDELAERGLYVYDWSDVHRVNAEQTNAYELISAPTVPLHLELLSPTLRALAQPINADFTNRPVSLEPASDWVSCPHC